MQGLIKTPGRVTSSFFVGLVGYFLCGLSGDCIV